MFVKGNLTSGMTQLALFMPFFSFYTPEHSVKCLHSEFFCSVFSHIWTEYGEILFIFPYSVRMHENADQKNSKYGYFSGGGKHQKKDQRNEMR